MLIEWALVGAYNTLRSIQNAGAHCVPSTLSITNRIRSYYKRLGSGHYQHCVRHWNDWATCTNSVRKRILNGISCSEPDLEINVMTMTIRLSLIECDLLILLFVCSSNVRRLPFTVCMLAKRNSSVQRLGWIPISVHVRVHGQYNMKYRWTVFDIIFTCSVYRFNQSLKIFTADAYQAPFHIEHLQFDSHKMLARVCVCINMIIQCSAFDIDAFIHCAGDSLVHIANELKQFSRVISHHATS